MTSSAGSRGGRSGRRAGVPRALRLLTLGIVALLAVVYLGVPIGFAAWASIRHPAEVGTPPPGFGNVTLAAEDGVALEAWYAPTSNGAAIILLHGATDSREGVRAHAQMLAARGYGVIAPDLRGHGESGGHGNAYGWEGTRDVRAAAAFLQQQPGVRAIGGLGLSLGGEILLGALNATPSLGAVASEGATYRSIGDFLALPGREGIVQSWMPRVMFAATGVFTGDEPPVPILESLAEAPDVPLLLIVSARKPSEVDYNTRFAETAGPRAEVWIVEDAGHTGAFAAHAGEYADRVGNFFEGALITPGWSGE